jgi:hypothetical protein
MRIMSVIGALALACLCLASPTIAASPVAHLTFDVISHELTVEPALDAANATALPDALPDIGAMLSADAANVDATSTGSAAWLSPGSMPYGVALALMNTDCRHYDPGWRVS